MNNCVPILDFEESREYEGVLLQGVSEKEYAAMECAGRALACSLAEDLKDLRPQREYLDILVLAGKGHNAGDAFIALEELSRFYKFGKVDVVMAFEREDMKPLANRALTSLSMSIRYISNPEDDQLRVGAYDLCLDGLLGLGSVGAARGSIQQILRSISTNENIRFQAAVDVPSGLSEKGSGTVFKADATYMCGIPKKILFEDSAVPYRGRLRFLDIGFYEKSAYSGKVNRELLMPSVLSPLNDLRDTCSDKRSYGHLVILAGSLCMPGALLMALKGALASGVGLITAMVPRELVCMLGHAVPEVMWLPLPVHRDHTLNIKKSFPLIRDALDKATVFMVGPGMPAKCSLFEVIRALLIEFPLPVVLDATALQKEVCDVLLERPFDCGRVLLTPHMGELIRLMGREESVSENDVKDYARKTNTIIYVKGAVGYITDGERIIYMSFGSPLLARGGSGDILAGLCGGLYATQDDLPLTTLSQAVMWHGLASQRLAREKGERAVRTTDLLEYLNPALRG